MATPTGKSQTGYEVGRPQGKCAVTGKMIEPGSKFMAALRETPAGFERADVSMEAWEQFGRADVIAFWQTVMPVGEQKKRIFVDDEVLCTIFERLNETTEPAKLNLRSKARIDRVAGPTFMPSFRVWWRILWSDIRKPSQNMLKARLRNTCINTSALNVMVRG